MTKCGGGSFVGRKILASSFVMWEEAPWCRARLFSAAIRPEVSQVEGVDDDDVDWYSGKVIVV
jgi:hypothetical protein